MKNRIVPVLIALIISTSAIAQNQFPSSGPTVIDNKIGFTSGLSDGTQRGIWLWRTADSNHVIYSSASTGISPAGNDAADGLWDSGHRLRLRTALGQGFLFENRDEIALIDIDADNGNLRSIGIAYFQGTGNNYFNGKVGIGTTDFSGTHKLRVEGSIGAREIKVEATGWSDFVFENDYNLPTLEKVEQHINEHGHLPEIPSEAEVAENGINLGEMDIKLLQKIEELTLYLIEQNKKLESQGVLIEKLQNEVTSLKNE